ncbi:tegument protein UL43 [Aotine betaherpesvirus 1]|uniref:Tegument protein UL43 n=1 Tax=Aotine betaherpesvirus 1 TaxID=50290 RepID=G8XUB8_9BETA|nr:tegument protein UL43 [Aotine betaherpesvirus 1]AEV80748.1 tegument protein UL43 [Aotine betaherpesvirus 1]
MVSRQIGARRAWIPAMEAPLDKEEPMAVSCDLVDMTYRASVDSGAPKNLLSLVRIRHGTKLLLPWPVGWHFTYYDFRRKGGPHSLSIKGIFKNYLCCDKFAVPVGIVGSEGGVNSFALVVVIGEKGRCYVYSYLEDAIYLVSRQGFKHLFEVGLYNLPPLRDEFSPSVALANGSLSEFVAATDLLSCWRLCRQHEGRVYAWSCDAHSVSLTVCGDHVLENRALHNEWLQATGSVNLINVFEATAWVDRAWLRIPILVNESGAVFGVDVDNHRTYFLARDLETFFKVAFLRFRNTYRYTNGCFERGAGTASASASVPAAFAPTDCPREVFCRRKKKTLLRSWLLRRGSL